MNQTKLSAWLKAIIIGMVLAVLAVYGFVVPEFASFLAGLRAHENPAFCNIWIAVISVTGLPILAALFFAWKIAKNIGEDKSFSMDNARALKIIFYLALGDAAYFFLANLVLFFCDLSHPGIFIISMLAVFVAAAVAVAMAALSHLVEKAAVLQDENDLTI